MINLKNLVQSLFNRYFSKNISEHAEEQSILEIALAESHAKQAHRAYEDLFSQEERNWRIEHALMIREMEAVGYKPMFSLDSL